MDAPPPVRKTDLAELILTPQDEPNSQLLAQLVEVIREAVELARKQGPPKINLKVWEPADQDAAPTPLAEAVHQAEDAIRDIGIASQYRAQELAEQARQPEKEDDQAALIRAAEEQLKKTVAELTRKGIVVVAEAIEPAPMNVR